MIQNCRSLKKIKNPVWQYYTTFKRAFLKKIRKKKEPVPVKEMPAPTGEEAQEPQEEQIEEVSVEPLPELVPETKPVKKEESWTKVVPKRKAKAKKEEEKLI